jgi:hypothetical protein
MRCALAVYILAIVCVLSSGCEGSIDVPELVLEADPGPDTTTIFNESDEVLVFLEARDKHQALIAQGRLELEPDENATYQRPEDAETWTVFSESSEWSWSVLAGDFVVE